MPAGRSAPLYGLQGNRAGGKSLAAIGTPAFSAEPPLVPGIPSGPGAAPHPVLAPPGAQSRPLARSNTIGTMRVVSLVPSATEIVALLGASEWLVGRSHECDHPPGVHAVPVLTEGKVSPGSGGLSSSGQVDRAVSAALDAGESLYRLDERRLQELKPDLIITQDLCSVCSIDAGSVARAAARLGPGTRILSLNPTSFEAVLDDIVRVGEALGLRERAITEMVRLRERFYHAADFVNPFTDPVPLLMLEWTDPPFVAGHWCAQLIERAGCLSLLNPTTPMEGAGSGAGGQMAHRIAGPSRRVTPDEIVAASPRAIIICPCGLNLAQTRREYLTLAAQPWWEGLPAACNPPGSGRGVMLVDGNQMFSRPGPRLVDAYRWLVGWLHGVPELMPEGFPAEPAQ